MQKSKGLMSKPLKVGGGVKMQGSSTLRVHQLTHTHTHTHTHTYLLVTRSQKSIIIIVDKHRKKERNPNII